jgi:hypothetical protein
LVAGGEASEAEDPPPALDEEGDRILRIRGFSDDDTITASPDLCRFWGCAGVAACDVDGGGGAEVLGAAEEVVTSIGLT